MPRVEIFSADKFHREDFISRLHFCQKLGEKIDENNSDRRIITICYMYEICETDEPTQVL